MIYVDHHIGFSFELPEGWSRIKHNLPSIFLGPNGDAEKVIEFIQLNIGSILSQYINRDHREAFLAEPGAQVFRGMLGDETNVAVLKKETSSEISAVRDGIHYMIFHSNDPVTLAAIESLCRSARFPKFQQACEAIASWSDPAQQAIAKALRSNSVEEARSSLISAGAPSVFVAPGISSHDLSNILRIEPKPSHELQRIPDDTPVTPQQHLLEKLDGGGKAAREAEDALVVFGNDALDDLLQSVAEINGRMNGTIRDGLTNPLVEMARLERRVRVMERIRSSMVIKALFDALTDSALAVDAYMQQRDAAYARHDFMTVMMAYEHIEAASSLNQAAINALVAFGEEVAPHAGRYLSTSPPAVVRALKKVISRLEHKWWRFWE
jgi:hypothetical protein